MAFAVYYGGMLTCRRVTYDLGRFDLTLALGEAEYDIQKADEKSRIDYLWMGEENMLVFVG